MSIKIEFKTYENLEELFVECKKALGILTDSGISDTVYPHFLSIVSNLQLGGISDSIILSERSVGVIARGVSDVWNYGSGEGKLSQSFENFKNQLAFYSGIGG